MHSPAALVPWSLVNLDHIFPKYNYTSTCRFERESPAIPLVMSNWEVIVTLILSHMGAFHHFLYKYVMD